ncbi:flagellar biosynthesis protein FlhF [Chromatocurvus halotolerans]|uniref:Flagellar biosynthesis protein FlhF n=1 Tax=Chromatocurvus halotolerans TaxID=1132028 RepID=A0A4R2KUT0_9GAMM|nr:flagellar biosynthesis protein FlhF [Chromatocurvus halotolerans]TCO76587.1 flagellar biosynthesis protein FlhF [Chromatocurvus halotolerans]
MQIKRYVAEDMRQALKQVRDEQGPDAVILSSRQIPDGLEVVAAVDYDETLIDPSLQGAGAATTSRPRSPLSSARPASARAQTADAGRRASAHAEPVPSAAPRSPLRPASRPASMRNDVAAPEESLSGMRDEIKALRRMLECQLSSLAWNDFSRQSPVRADLLRNLLQLGLPSPLAQDITARVPADERDPARAWRQALTDFAHMVAVEPEDPLMQGGVMVLVGPTGVGKTTAIARFAAHYAEVHGSEHVAMISTDNSRPGAQECLFSAGRLLNIPVYQANTAAEVQERLNRLAHVRVVLVDTAGAARDDHDLGQSAGLGRPDGRIVTRYLVLAANAQIQALEEAVMLYSRQSLNGIIATKLDETASLGGLLSVVALSGLPLVRVSDSADLSRPLRTLSSRRLVKRGVSLMRESPRRMDKESVAQHIGEMHYALG